MADEFHEERHRYYMDRLNLDMSGLQADRGSTRLLHQELTVLVRDQIQPNMIKALQRDNDEPFVVATGFRRDLWELFDRVRGNRYLKFMYLEQQETLCFMGDPHHAHELIRLRMGKYIGILLANALEDAPDAGPAFEELWESDEGTRIPRGQRILDYFAEELGSTAVSLSVPDLGDIEKEADWAIQAQGGGVCVTPVATLEVAVSNESRVLAAKENVWWSDGGCFVSLSMKVNRSSPYAFNPKITLFTGVKERYDGETRFVRKSYEVGRGSGVPASEKKLYAVRRNLPSYDSLTRGLDFEGNEKIRKVDLSALDFEPMPRGTQDIELHFGAGLTHSWLAKLQDALQPTVAFSEFLDNVCITLSASTIRTFCLKACLEEELSMHRDVNKGVLRRSTDAGDTALLQKVKYLQTSTSGRTAIADYRSPSDRLASKLAVGAVMVKVSEKVQQRSAQASGRAVARRELEAAKRAAAREGRREGTSPFPPAASKKKSKRKSKAPSSEEVYL